MTREQFLTKQWNDWLSLGLGLPTLIFAIVASFTNLWTTLPGMIGLSVIGALY